jgi:hypothetical protein
VAAEHQGREHQYTFPTFDASAQREEERHTFTSFLEDAERHRRERVMACRCPPSWETQKEGMMSTATSLPLV